MSFKIEIEPYELPTGAGGGCPSCGGADDSGLGYYIWRWDFCKRHRVKWPSGEDNDKSFEGETEQLWESNASVLTGYESVIPAGGCCHVGGYCKDDDEFPLALCHEAQSFEEFYGDSFPDFPQQQAIVNDWFGGPGPQYPFFS